MNYLLKKFEGHRKGSLIGRTPETSFNNRLAQRPKGKQQRFIIESFDRGVFVSQAQIVK